MKVPVFIVIFLLSVFKKTHTECVSRNYDFGSTVCVCDSEQCDTLPKPEQLEPSQYYVYTSNKAGLRFQKEVAEFSLPNESTNPINIDPEQKYQTVLGFGGSFTDSAGINIASLNDDLQEKLLRSYFSEDGLEYNLCRVPMGASDFSTHAYSYDDGEPDPELTNFALDDADHQYKIPYMKKALELTNNNLEFFASAWTAPKWMRTNDKYNGVAFIKNEFYQTWADYFVKFLDSYKEEGITFWGITTGNEPHDYVFDIELNYIGWIALTMSKWIDDNLGPAIRQSEHSDIKIITLDDQRVYLPWFANLLFISNNTRSYVDGIAVHYYFDSFVPPSWLDSTHEQFPEKFIINSEACTGLDSLDNPVMLGSWERGEKYSADIIEDFTHWVSAWVDWNMALDETGGPSYIVDTHLDSPIIVNATAGEFYKQPMYYHLGHFSKFVPKGSVRIEATTEFEDVTFVAFQRPDNGTTVIILNQAEEVVHVDVVDGTRGTAQLELSERSITTLLYW